jgi:phage terminase large subunit-like protein
VVCWNGAIIRLRSAQRPDRFRGPNNDGVIADEIDSWRPEHVSASEAFTILEMTVRGNRNLQILASSTPKRGGLVGELSKRDDCTVIRGTMRDNILNLSSRFVETMFDKTSECR